MARHHRYVLFAAALLFTIALTLPGAASASTVMEYQMQYEPATEYSLLIVTAVANPQLPLPVTVSVPVPAGATMLWAGELLGGAATDDPTRETTMETIGDMDVYTMTLEQAYTAQLELQLPPVSASGSRVVGGLTWTNPGDEVPVRASVIVPAGATDVEVSPALSGETDTNEQGATLYPLSGSRLAQGAAMVVEVSWTSGGSAAGGTASSSALPIVLGLLVLAVVALVFVVVRERTRARRSPADSSEL